MTRSHLKLLVTTCLSGLTQMHGHDCFDTPYRADVVDFWWLAPVTKWVSPRQPRGTSLAYSCLCKGQARQMTAKFQLVRQEDRGDPLQPCRPATLFSVLRRALPPTSTPQPALPHFQLLPSSSIHPLNLSIRLSPLAAMSTRKRKQEEETLQALPSDESEEEEE